MQIRAAYLPGLVVLFVVCVVAAEWSKTEEKGADGGGVRIIHACTKALEHCLLNLNLRMAKTAVEKLMRNTEVSL